MSIDKSAPGGDYYKGGETTAAGGHTYDSDGDGVADQVGYDTNGDGIDDTFNIDTNGDQWTDTTVTDFDGDGYADAGSATVYHNQYDTGQNAGSTGSPVSASEAPAAEPAPSNESWTAETFDDVAGESGEAFDAEVFTAGGGNESFESAVFGGAASGSDGTTETAPGESYNSPYYDGDGDGYAEAQDTYTANGEYVGTSWDTNHDYVQDVFGADTNDDGIIDTYSLDVDHDGATDMIAYDTNQDGIVDEMHADDVS